MREALLLKKEQEGLDIEIPEERTIYRIMQKMGISHRPRKPKGLTNDFVNHAGGKCHDARCESMWARMKVELFYSRKDKPENYTIEELKTKIWHYYMSYWNSRICSANHGLPLALKRRLYYQSLKKDA